jgi:DNA repair protein RecO (recombination protein O)
MRAGTQLLSYASFTLYESRGRYTVNAAEPVELFVGLRNDILSLSLASYMAEVLEAVSDEENPDPDLLATGLNCMYALSVRKKPRALIKAVFEMRVTMLSGYAPDASECAVCGEQEPDDPVLDIRTGRVGCAACMERDAGTVPLCAQSLLAIRYILTAESKKLLSFSLGEEPLARLSEAAERYLQSRFEREFATLKFYKSLL